MKRVIALPLLVALVGCPKDDPKDETYRDPRAPCTQSEPLRDVFFGDLHVHTGYSFDAWVFDVHTTPDDAYQFAKGQPIKLPPLDADGKATRELRISRPLDFAAVTDHSEFLGEIRICTDPARPGYESSRCQAYRIANPDVIVEFGGRLIEESPQRFRDVCDRDFGRCTEIGQEVWGEIQAAAEAHYDRTEACQFTSFVAYEWTGVTATSNYHRNVIFRNDRVPAFVASYFDFPTPKQLWEVLKGTCLDSDNGCDVVSIPHNTNWSNGNMFFVEYPGATSQAEEAAQAKLRAQMEPLIEIFQHKGDSECSNGLSGIIGQPDELCDFEKLRPNPPDCGDGTGFGGIGGIGCVSRLDFLRGILLEGLKEERRIGVNPYQLGVIASTDTHNGTPGAAAENGYAGHWGVNEDSNTNRLADGTLTPGGIIFNGGGLVALWAEANNRDSLFDAMKRKESYGTSGPRIVVRFFGGWSYADNLCGAADMVKSGYDQGVPMGSMLPAKPASASAPSFVVSAMQDPDGTPLQAVQVVKGWLDAAGSAHIKVFDVAGDRNNGATVDEATCTQSGPGSSSLCTVWTDPEFVATQPAYYYVRVVENPVCRWSWQACLTFPEADRPPRCADPEVAKVINERAWTSPIWYSP